MNALYQASSWHALSELWYSSIVSLYSNMYTQNCYGSIRWPMLNFLLLTLEMRPYTGSSLVTTGVQVASNLLGLVSISVVNRYRIIDF